MALEACRTSFWPPNWDHLLPAVTGWLVLADVHHPHGELGPAHGASVVLVDLNSLLGIDLGGRCRKNGDEKDRDSPDHHAENNGEEDVDEEVAGQLSAR